MCGIVGYIGTEEAAPILLEGLRRLVVYMHRGNIHRLLTGTENKFSLHKKQ